ncbi:MAG: hypothetical protein P1V20_28460 [Verrucomicrobiales bacterium]|nr:hypothetical protein [Verrucomicrobiales bacterium]
MTTVFAVKPGESLSQIAAAIEFLDDFDAVRAEWTVNFAPFVIIAVGGAIVRDSMDIASPAVGESDIVRVCIRPKSSHP